jgi:hypothetical protein
VCSRLWLGIDRLAFDATSLTDSRTDVGQGDRDFTAEFSFLRTVRQKRNTRWPTDPPVREQLELSDFTTRAQSIK